MTTVDVGLNPRVFVHDRAPGQPAPDERSKAGVMIGGIHPLHVLQHPSGQIEAIEQTPNNVIKQWLALGRLRISERGLSSLEDIADGEDHPAAKPVAKQSAKSSVTDHRVSQK